MATVVTENETAQPAASDNDNARLAPPVAKLLDPQLLMAACHGDSERLKELLQLKKDDEEHAHGMVEAGAAAAAAAAAASEVVIVEVVPRHPPAPAAAPAPPLDVDGVTREGDTLLHMVAASGDGPEFLLCARMIVRHKNEERKKKGLVVVGQVQVVEARNSKGDTPLHCAARSGNVNMISCLVDLIAGDDDDNDEAAAVAAKKKGAFVRIQNDCGETALHQAIRAPKNNLECISQLMDVDPELACIPRDEEGVSPLYLAISLGEVEIAVHLFSTSGGKLSYSGPDGRNVLHAAVSCGRETLLTVVLGFLEGGTFYWRNRKVQVRMINDDDSMGLRQEEDQAADDDRRHRDLLSRLASQQDTENESTPLHLAASLFGLPSAKSLPWQVRPRTSVAATRRLLDANEAMAYRPDKAGLYPIHAAAGSGSLDAVKMLLERCPGCATLRDAKGRTLLHVAAEEGRLLVVKYVCQQSQKQSRRARPGAASAAAARLPGLLSSILNAQDINGDTPLHRAVNAGKLRVVWRLIRNQQLRLDVPNKVGMRPIDVSWTTMPLEAYYAWDPRLKIRRTLLSVGAPYGENNRGDLFRKKRILSKEDKEMSQNVTDAAQVLALFSVLITTVTFASAFTLPGGYRSAGDGGGGVAGTPVLAGPKSYAFDAFILSDTLAFVCSLLATSILLYAGVPYGTLTNRFKHINFAYTLMWHAARSLVAAFALGLYVVLLPVARTIAIAIGVLMIMSVYGFLKDSEGIDASIILMWIFQPRRPKWRIVLDWILYLLDRFWSYIIIFGLPAIRRWARLP